MVTIWWTLNISVDKQGAEPVYVQIRRQVEELIRSGLLEAGSKLPSVRQLAASIGVSKNTVALAFEELAARNLIDTRHGSGAYVSEHPDIATGVDLGRRGEMAGKLGDFPAMRWTPYEFCSEFFGLPVSQHDRPLIRLTSTYPDPALFPLERIKQVASNMLWQPQQFFFDIGDAQGYEPLVEHLEKQMALYGVPMAAGQNDIILTGGFQRALALVLDFVMLPGQKAAIETPCFPGVLNLLIAKRLGFVPVPLDQHGMDTDYLAGVLARGEVQAIIVTPAFQNPSGATMPKERREHLLRLAMQYRVPVIEDDWGRLLRYEGEDQPPLKAMDEGGYVIHIGTFSKCFLPGLRIGWITCPAAISKLLYRAKVGADNGDSFFAQALLFELIQKGHFDRHVRKLVKECGRRRAALCSALAARLPKGCSFKVPQGGMSVWVKLPAWMPSQALLVHARMAGVEFMPASLFQPDKQDAPYLRLSFSRTSPERITEGVKVLCAVIGECIANPAKLNSIPHGYEELFQ